MRVLRLTTGAVLSVATASSAQTLLYSNGPAATGPTTESGMQAPAGTQWSEASRDQGSTTAANAVAGFGALQNTWRLADDFDIADPRGWRITGIRVLAYQTGSSITPTITHASLRIWDHDPSLGGEPVFGDAVTNRLVGASFFGAYRCFNTIVPAINGPPIPPTLNRPLMNVDIGVDVVLPPGRYWLDWALAGSLPSVACPPVTVAGLRQPVPNPNAIQLAGGVWVPTVDNGQGISPFPVLQDLFFEIRGQVVCYANCDGSTGMPKLTASDFVCFINAFAGNQSYANCDGSTGNPALTGNDFVCFVNAYAAGCI